MAVPAMKAFGAYLKTVRGRAGLSLQKVEDLSLSSPSPVSKNYLSRCEHGRLGLALGKMTVLCRIYNVPSDVVLERMELDLELEQIGGPDTEKMSIEELVATGREFFENGDYWPAYACFRDAIPLADDPPPLSMCRDRDEYRQVLTMHCATEAMRLGKSRFAMHEFQTLAETNSFSDSVRCLLFNRLANASRYLGKFVDARLYSDRSISLSEQLGETAHHSYYLLNRASIAWDDHDLELAEQLARKSQALAKKRNDVRGSLYALRILGDVYIEQSRFSAAKRALSIALEYAEQLSSQALIGKLLLSMGTMENKNNHPKKALECWRRAKTHARKVNHKLLLFQTDLCILEQAIALNLQPQKRNAQRRLARLLPFLPKGLDDIEKYERLIRKSS